MSICYLGLGSNLRSPERQLRQALESLHNLPDTAVVKISTLYFSKACGVRAQPLYCNLAIALFTRLTPKQLLYFCQKIEHKQQRIRKKHWGARTIDIDILLYDKHIVKKHNLIIPHPQMLKRDFVLVPLLEIAPDIQFPNGETIHTYLKNCQKYLTTAH